jgi:hypothetical protein
MCDNEELDLPSQLKTAILTFVCGVLGYPSFSLIDVINEENVTVTASSLVSGSPSGSLELQAAKIEY